MWGRAPRPGNRLGKGPKMLSREGSFSSQSLSLSLLRCGRALLRLPAPPSLPLKEMVRPAGLVRLLQESARLGLARVSRLSGCHLLV